MSKNKRLKMLAAALMVGSLYLTPGMQNPVMPVGMSSALAAEPSASATSKSQYVAIYGGVANRGDSKIIDGQTYIFQRSDDGQDWGYGYWVRKGYTITVTNSEEGKYTPLSDNGQRVDVQYIGEGNPPEEILSSIQSTEIATGTSTNLNESLQKIDAGTYSGVTNAQGTEIDPTWDYIIEDSSWKDSVIDKNYKDGYDNLKYPNRPKGFVTTESSGSKLKWDEKLQSYTYDGQRVDYSNLYVIDGKTGVFTNKEGSKIYTGTVYGLHNEVLTTVQKDGKLYSYWAAKVTDPKLTMETYRVADYQKDLDTLTDNDQKLYRNDIKEVRMTKSEDGKSATFQLYRNGEEGSNGVAVDGAMTFSAGGGTGGSGTANDTYVQVSDGTNSVQLATGTKVEVGTTGTSGITSLKINGTDYTIQDNDTNTYVTSGTVTEKDGKTVLSLTRSDNTIVPDIDLSAIKGTTYTAGKGITISDDGNNTISVKAAENGNLNVTDAGVALNNNVDLTADGSLTVGSVSISNDGINAGNHKITNVAAGEANTDAVNFGQLKDYQSTNDKYVTGGTVNNENGTINLTGTNGLTATVTGLKDYISDVDDYAVSATLDKDNTLTVTRKSGDKFSVNLSSITSGLSSTDYRLVSNTDASGNKTAYTVSPSGKLTLKVQNTDGKTENVTIDGIAVVYEDSNLKSTDARGIWNEIGDANKKDDKTTSIALGKNSFVSVQDGRKGNAILFGNDKYTGGIAIGENSTALNNSVTIGIQGYTGKIGNVDLSNDNYDLLKGSGVATTTVGSNSYSSGSLATNIGAYNIATTSYAGNSLFSSLYAGQNSGSVMVGSLNSIESYENGTTSGIANNVIGLANKTNNTNGSIILGAGNEITNSIQSIASVGSTSYNSATEAAEAIREGVKESSGGAVLAIGGGNKADYAVYSQLMGVNNELTGTNRNKSQYDLVNGYNNKVTNAKNTTVMGINNNLTDSETNVVIGDNHTVAKEGETVSNTVILGSQDKQTATTASDAVILGHNANVSVDGGVALGSGSQATTDKDITGAYAPTTGADSPTWTSTAGAVSVGGNGITRQITNVAAGSADTDAVNVAQLNAVAETADSALKDSSWKLTASGANGTDIKQGSTVDFSGAKDENGHSNVIVSKGKNDNNIQISLDENVKGITSVNGFNIVKGFEEGSVNTDDGMVLNIHNQKGKGVTVNGVNIKQNNVTGLTNKTLDVEGFAESGRAATEEQLKQVSDVAQNANKGWYLSVEDGEAQKVAPGETVNFSNRDGNIFFSQEGTNIEASLNPNVTLGDKTKDGSLTVTGKNGDVIKLNGSDGSASIANGQFTVDKDGNLNAENADGSYISMNGGTIAINSNGSGLNINDMQTSLTHHNSKVIITDDGTRFTNGKGSTKINGDNIYAGDTVVVNGTEGKITGLTNTEWSDEIAKTADKTQAASQGQLNTVWEAAKNAGTEAAKHTTVVGGSNVNVAEGTNEDGGKEYTVNLDNDVALKDANGNETIKFNGSDGSISVASDKFTVDKDGNISAENAVGNYFTMNEDLIALNVNGSGLNINSDQTTVSHGNSKVIITNEGTRFTDGSGTTKINGNNIYAGDNIVVNGEKGIVIGLANVDWTEAVKKSVDENKNGEASQAATQGQLSDLNDYIDTLDEGNVKYNVKDGTIDYSNIVLAGDTYNNKTKTGGTLITNVAYATDKDGGSAAVNVDKLNDVVNAAKDELTANDQHIQAGVYAPDENGKVSMPIVDNNGKEYGSVSIENVAKADDLGDVGNINEDLLNKDGSHTTVVDGLNNLNDKVDDIGDRVTNIEGDITDIKGNTITNGDITENGDINLKNDKGETQATVSGLTDSSLSDAKYDASKGELTLTTKDKYGNDADKNFTVGNIASKDDIKNINTVTGADSKENLQEQYKDTNFIKDADNMVDADKKLDQAVSDNRDAIINNANNISNLDRRVSDLDSRVNKVGALAVAMAGLHPLGYDPEAPTEFSAAVGNYKGETALAVGVFHHPNEDVLLSVGASIAGDETAVNAGATFRFGRRGHNPQEEAERKAREEAKLAAEKAAQEEAYRKTMQYKIQKALTYQDNSEAVSESTTEAKDVSGDTQEFPNVDLDAQNANSEANA